MDPQEQMRQAVAFYLSGLGLEKSARRAHMSEARLRNELARGGQLRTMPEARRMGRVASPFTQVAQARLEAAVPDYLAGVSVENAASAHGISAHVLSRLLRERGLLRNRALRNQMSVERSAAVRRASGGLPVEEMAARYRAGDAIVTLARDYHTTRAKVMTRLRAQGIALRTQSEQQTLDMARLTPAQRQQRAAMAHVAARGRRASEEEWCRIAHTRQARGLHISPYEVMVRDWLTALGVDSIPQQAIGRYNADLGVADCLCVELHGGGWHGAGYHQKRAGQRLRYITERGWNLAIVWIDNRRYPLEPAIAERLRDYAEQARTTDLHGRVRVYGGDGREFAPGDYGYDRAFGLLAPDPIT